MIKISFEKKTKAKKKTRSSWLWEFSKKIIFTLTILYFIERIFAMIMIWINGADIDTFLETGTQVFMAGVISYACKAGLENVAKIKKDDEEENTSNGMAD